MKLFPPFRMFSLFTSSDSISATRSAVAQQAMHLYVAQSALNTTVSAAVNSTIHLFYNDVYEVQLPLKHRFPMQKYRLVRVGLQQEYSQHPNVKFTESPLATKEELTTTHCKDYVERYFTGRLTEHEQRASGFPWSIQQVHRSTSSVGGTVAAMRAVLATPLQTPPLIAGHIAGGTHHAFFDHGEGFCIFNDIAVAANLALQEYPSKVRRIAIIDLDVHQGNGNAVLFQNQPNVLTFSIHCRENYFSTIQHSDVDVELPAGTSDELYLSKLKTWLPYLVKVFKPDLVFFQAGVDVHRHDRLGRLALTREGIRQRNRLLLGYLRDHAVKCVVCMGGG